MDQWQPVPDEQSYGVVIYNFMLDSDYKISLNCGETVHILEECVDWYRGYVINNKSVNGIFPKSYIQVLECIVQREDPDSPTFILHKQPSIVQEITNVLREWGTLWKRLYVTHSKNFEQIQKQIYELIKHRSKILSQTLPTDEMKKITKQVTIEIDMGNRTLGLDMVVRDKNGNLLNPDETSTIQLYYHHRYATERMNAPKTECKDNAVKTAIQQYSHIFIVSVKNFTGKMTEDAELLMTLYDAKENKAITESYVVRWSKDGLMSDLDQMYNLRVIFTDLGKKDLERERIYLVCYVVRIGAMEIKEIDRRNSVTVTQPKKNTADDMRRPFGVAAKDVTAYMSGKLESDLEQEFAIPFFNCDKDNLEQTLKKITNKDTKSDNKNQNLYVSLRLLHGDVKQVREEHPHLLLGTFAVAKKMGFPEVILPGDVRNDLYLTLIQGEFPKGNKTSDKNIEVTVRVCNENGVTIPNVISIGGGVESLIEYRSVIYYHELKPQWYETFKVAIPIEEFKTSHLKFFFKHRSSNEAKDKSEKYFAMCYVKLMQADGTTLKDATHSLVVYKIDNKKFDEKSTDYFQLPSTIEELKMGNSKPQVSGLSHSAKESFIISSNICSTKLTQNVDLLGLLNWATHKETLEESLKKLIHVVENKGEEVVKFFQDILDALFDILMDNPNKDTYDELVFQCLLSVVALVSNDWKYAHFEPVLDMYIKESFSATLAYRKLIAVLKKYIDNATSLEPTKELYRTMKSFQYLMKFITRSRLLYIALHQNESDDDFESMLIGLLDSIVKMMRCESDKLLREQGACLKYLPSTIPDILLVFDSKQLSVIFCDLLDKLPAGRLTKQKMMTINDIVHSHLFLYPECRAKLLPYFTAQIKKLIQQAEEGIATPGLERRRPGKSVAKVARVLGETELSIKEHKGYGEEVELCIKILSDILDLLFRKDIGNTSNDISEIMITDLRTVIQSHINMDKKNSHAGNLVAIMIDIFRQMNESHYEKYINCLNNEVDVKDFLMEILMVFKELVNESVFSSDWSEMIMLQNCVILKALRLFSLTIRDRYFSSFDHQAWNNFFHCAIAYITQPSLQLETFSHNKRMRVTKRYKDMRREMGLEVSFMWFNLGQHKLKFVPSLVGLILEMTLIPEIELRKATIPIFFDMMQCEFYSSKFEMESFGDTKRDSSHVKGNFADFENEMIAKLDTLVEGGRGDEDYKTLFYNIMMERCTKHAALKEDGIRFIQMITRLMERLLQYRCIINDENKENRMSCTVKLLDFYSEINRKEMYIRYVNKLCDLHKECENYTEAAFALQLHSNLLNWSDDTLPLLLKANRYSDLHTHRELKQALYNIIIEYYDKGEMWECALEKCKELLQQHEEETFEYEKLSELHNKMAEFYSYILKKVRPEPEYFRVAYYGRGFPQFLQNTVFVYRGKPYERLHDFNNRILNDFPIAQSLTTLTQPGPDILESNGQYIQINKVDPVMDEKKHRFSGKPVSEQIVKYYKVNHVDKFCYSRPFSRKHPNLDPNNEFANLWLERTYLTTTYPLPGILRWFPVKSSKTEEISPLNYAIETMENTNKDLRNFVLAFNKDKDKTLDVKPLSSKLYGIVDPAVMGGIMNYEKAFFTPEYLESFSDDHTLIAKLKELIAEQIPLLELCLQIHKDRAPISVQGLHLRMEDCFSKMQEQVIEKYGKKTCDLKLDNHVTIRRHFSMVTPITRSNTVNETGSRSRVPSITRTPIGSFRAITGLNSSSVSYSKHASHINSKTSLLSPTKSLNNSTISNKRGSKTPKEKRKSNKTEVITSPNIFISGTQWYTVDNENSTTNGSPVIELRQELTPKRPLRSEVEKEKRLSRPNSGQYSRPSSVSLTIRAASSSGNSSNRDSVGTTDSSISEEDLVPPPLPVKLREADYCNLPNPCENVSFLHSSRNSTRCTIHDKLPYPEPTETEPPPTPPPKPPKKKCQ